MFGGLGNIFGVGKKEVAKPQDPAALPGEQQGRKVTKSEEGLAFGPSAPAPAAASMEGKNITIKDNDEKTEVLRRLLANATLEEKTLFLSEMNSSLAENYAKKNKEVSQFLREYYPT